MVLPLIAAGIGVLGTVASIKAQSDAASAQNKSINLQIAANKREQEMMDAMNKSQKVQLEQVFAQETLQRRAAFRETDNAMKLALQQNQLQMELNRQQAETNYELSNRAARDARLQMQQDEANERVNRKTERAGAVANAAQIRKSGETPPTASGSARRAMMEAAGAGKGVTSSLLKENNAGNDVATAAIDEYAAAEGERQNVVDMADRQLKAGEDTMAMQRGIDRANMELAKKYGDERTAAQLALSENISANNESQLAIQRGMLNKAGNIANRQARIDRKIRRTEIDVGNSLRQAQAGAAQAQLYAQRQSGPNLGTSLAMIGQQALPLVEAIVPKAQVTAPTATPRLTRASSLDTGVLIDDYNSSAANSYIDPRARYSPLFPTSQPSAPFAPVRSGITLQQSALRTNSGMTQGAVNGAAAQVSRQSVPYGTPLVPATPANWPALNTSNYPVPNYIAPR